MMTKDYKIPFDSRGMIRYQYIHKYETKPGTYYVDANKEFDAIMTFTGYRKSNKSAYFVLESEGLVYFLSLQYLKEFIKHVKDMKVNGRWTFTKTGLAHSIKLVEAYNDV